MTTFHSKYPFLKDLQEPPYSDNPSMPVNDKPHEVYCQICQYRIIIEGLAEAKCGNCRNYLISVVKSIIP